MASPSSIESEYRALSRKYDHRHHDYLVGKGLCLAGDARQNIEKNRYCNLFPLDEHRVKLSVGKRERGDYINASWVDVKCLNDKFIIAQGPMHPDWHGPDTTGDFWRMVYENDVRTIVNMGGRPGTGYSSFARYWPGLGDGRVEDFGGGGISVERKKGGDLGGGEGGTLIREFTVGANRGGDGGRLVRHFSCTEWPNYGVPEDTSSVRRLMKMVREYIDAVEGTTVIHCSGGVGRSGTFLTAFAGVYGGGGTLIDIVQEIREQRHPMAVEGFAQYEFAYKCVAEW